MSGELRVCGCCAFGPFASSNSAIGRVALASGVMRRCAKFP